MPNYAQHWRDFSRSQYHQLHWQRMLISKQERNNRYHALIALGCSPAQARRLRDVSTPKYHYNLERLRIERQQAKGG